MSLRIDPPAANTSGAGTANTSAVGQPTRNAYRSRAHREHLLALALATLAVCLAAAAPSAHAEECPNAAYRTGPSAHLPDCRAYELVTPPFKNGGEATLRSSNPEGSSLLLESTSAMVELEGFPDVIFGPVAYYTTQRTAAGWATVADDPPASEYRPLNNYTETYDFAGADLDSQTTVWLERKVGQPENSLNLFERLPDRSIVEVGPSLPPTAPLHKHAFEEVVHPVGMSADGSRVLFDLDEDYWPFDPTTSGLSLYEYEGTGKTTPMLVGVNEAGALISTCGTALGSIGPSGTGSTRNAMSMNGQTIFFTAECGARVGDELYARIDNGEPDARTVDISEPSQVDCGACDIEAGVLSPARFENISEDGSKVFFTTSQPLLDGTGGLYEYDFNGPPGEKVRLIAASAGVIQISNDGSHVYFESREVLTTAPNIQGQKAQPGVGGAYVYDTETGQYAFITAGEVGPSTVTPNGRFLVFDSESDLTPDDTSKGVWQLFEYDAQTGGLVRVSIGQDGFNNDGNVTPTFSVSNPTAIYDNADNAELPTRLNGDAVETASNAYDAAEGSSGASVSANGQYVFFQSTVGLTPQAFDRKLLFTKNEAQFGYLYLYANNIYEYHDGRVSLISDGKDVSYVQNYNELHVVKLLGTNESGSDVFFTTTDQLVGQDSDTAVDIYDARIDGGFPAPTVPPSCAGESCQGQLSGAPTLLSPGSEFQAGGNPPLAAPAVSKVAVKPKAKCRRDTTLKHGTCVKTKATGKKTRKAATKRRAK